MKKIENKEFDKLDKKIFNEMPFLIDIISAWGNKIKQIFNPMCEEVEKIIDNQFGRKSAWTLHTKDINVCYPFAENYSNQTKIVNLDDSFGVYSYFYLHKIGKKDKNHLNFEFG